MTSSLHTDKEAPIWGFLFGKGGFRNLQVLAQLPAPCAEAQPVGLQEKMRAIQVPLVLNAPQSIGRFPLAYA